MIGENQEQNLRVVQCANDGIGVVLARGYIAWRNPTADSLTLEKFTNRISQGLVLRGITDENRRPGARRRRGADPVRFVL
jgi:hypothetical protein